MDQDSIEGGIGGGGAHHQSGPIRDLVGGRSTNTATDKMARFNPGGASSSDYKGFRYGASAVNGNSSQSP